MIKLFSSMKMWKFTVAVTLAWTVLTAGAHASVWTLSGALGTHDPSIYKEGGTWWIFETSNNGIGVKYSSDGHRWTQGLNIFKDGLNWWHHYNGNRSMAWSPDIHKWGGKVVCFYAVSQFGARESAIGLTTASSVQKGDWTDQGPILTSKSTDSYNAIDPNFVQDSAGRPWLSFGSYGKGICIVKLNPRTLKPLGHPTHIAMDSTGVEAPFIVRNGGYYYLFVSKGTCCSGKDSTYHICYGRSRSISGHYKDKKGVNMLAGGGTTLDSAGGRFIAPGGQSICNGVLARHELDSKNNYASILFINDLSFPGGWPSY